MKLEQLFSTGLSHRCDKWSSYFDVYEAYFDKFINKNPTIVEVGVAGGGSLEMWSKYFHNADVYGIDIAPQVEAVENATLILGDQSNPEFWDNFLVQVPNIDIFIDDGSHLQSHQILTFYKVFPHITDGGVYICEDTHASYWEEYDGGLQRSNTFIEFAKQLIDCLHTEHMRGVKPSDEFYALTKDITQVSFFDSQVVITKGKRNNKRVTVNGK